MSSIGIAYTEQGGSGQTYNVVMDTFSGAEIARVYDASAEFERGISGQQVVTGRPGRQKFIWAISAVVTKAKAKEIDDAFRAWDADRATGLAAAVGITDETLFDPITTSAVFSTPPSYIRMNHNTFTVAFGLTEV